MGLPSKYHGFCFTVNNYTPDDARLLAKFFAKHCSYMIYAAEKAPTTGTDHYQGYFWCNNKKTKQTVVRALRTGIFIGVPGASKPPSYWVHYCSHHDPNKPPTPDCTYCTPDFKPKGEQTLVFEGGICPTDEEHLDQCTHGQGAATPLIRVKRRLDEGASLNDCMLEEDTFEAIARHKPFLANYQSFIKRRKVEVVPEVFIFHGPTGTGKSAVSHALAQMGVNGWKWNAKMKDFMNGYAGESHVIFEEFRGQIDYDDMLQLTDKYVGTTCNTKHGFSHWSPTHIYFTSPLTPEDWWPRRHAKDKLDQFMRRVTHMYDTTGEEFKRWFAYTTKPILCHAPVVNLEYELD